MRSKPKVIDENEAVFLEVVYGDGEPEDIIADAIKRANNYSGVRFTIDGVKLEVTKESTVLDKLRTYRDQLNWLYYRQQHFDKNNSLFKTKHF